MTQWVAYTDGASRGNPGLSGCGAYLVSTVGKVHACKKFLGKATNNQAEYEAVVLALTELKKLAATHILIRADSELAIRQLQGRYKVKSPHILPLYEKVRELAHSFESVSFEHIPREKNKQADRLANEAIDEAPHPFPSPHNVGRGWPKAG